MGSRNWTQSQMDAINARGGSLLVSAAAGSGKTAVLVQRVIERLTDPEHPSDADRLLVVTFTKAAAAEMQERIALSLAEALAGDPGNANLQRQQVLLTKAHISTVHSFCSELVRENFYKLNISPDFRILDESEMALLRSDAATRVLEEAYETGGPEFSDLVEAFSSDRDDSRLIQTIHTLYDFIRSHPFPERWLGEKAAMYRSKTPAGRTPWGECVLRFAADAVDYCVSLTENCLGAMAADEKIDAAYRGAYESDLASLRRLRESVRQKDWDAVGEQVCGFVFTRLNVLRGYQGDPLKIRLNACRDEVKATVKKLGKLFGASGEECARDIKELAPMVEQLFTITVRFSKALDALKAERKAADFGDLEHWALRLLVEDTEAGPRRTEEAVELSGRFDEIMVDEYQDTNEAQDMLFRAVSRNEENLFMVGDVKQSIYSFRQAMPKIFLERRASFPPYDRERDAYPASVVLDRNFRSRKEVTGAVNFVFGQLMSREMGDVDYKGNELLAAGAQYPEQPGCNTRLDIIDASLCGDAEEKMEVLESRQIAGIILQMMSEGFEVGEGGRRRPVLYRDFCVLLRSANQHAPEYVRELQKCGIPAWTDASGGFFCAAEVAAVLSLLRVVDNPMQDIPLVSVLMSPIYGFTPDDMAEVRLESGGSVYLALLAAARNGNARAADFLQDMEQYRTFAATMPADKLINAVYEKTGYLNMVQAMPGGELRLNNLHLLLEHAKKYEASGYHGLSGFIRFIDRLQEQHGDLAAASAISEAADVVRVMSIHKSKGLEFPVCIIAGCSRRFNKERGDALLHPELGLGVKLKDTETLCRYTTLPREAIALEQEREAMSEELRVLYVAMTRAREKLVLLTTVKNLDKQLGGLTAQITEDSAVPPYVVRSASSISDWLLSCALRLPEGSDLRERALAQENIVVGSPGTHWEIGVYPPVFEQSVEGEKEEESLPPPNPELLKKLRKKLDFVYPYAPLSRVPAKVAASELASREFEEQYAAVSRPAFLGKTGLTPAERGSALHAYLQFADYARAKENPQAELERLVCDGFLLEEQAAAVDLRRVEAFLQSGIAARILASPNSRREYRFTVEIPALRVAGGLPEDLLHQPVVLQGAVDCVFEEDGELVIVDYKTDRAKEAPELWRRYEAQLALYREAVSQCLGLPVKECLLYSFHLNRQISAFDAGGITA